METKAVSTQTKWIHDLAHSEIVFKVKHLMITSVKGEFQKFQVEVDSTKDDFSYASISTTIDAGSVFTNEAKRTRSGTGITFSLFR